MAEGVAQVQAVQGEVGEGVAGGEVQGAGGDPAATASGRIQ